MTPDRRHSADKINFFIKERPETVPPKLLRDFKRTAKEELQKVFKTDDAGIRVEPLVRASGDWQLKVYERGSRTSDALMVVAARVLLPLYQDFHHDLNWARFSLAEWKPGRTKGFDEDMRVLRDLQEGACLGMSKRQRAWCIDEVLSGDTPLTLPDLVAMSDAQLASEVLTAWQSSLCKL